jgi:UDPglucose 6-dehydrogenase
MNQYQQLRFVSTMVSAMFNSVANKRIAIFGAAFKADTADTRDSPALAICRALLEERADIVLTDPHALHNARADLGEAASQVTFEPDPRAAARGAHAIAVLTAWPQFAELDYRAIYQGMVKPAYVFDGRNLLDAAYLHAIGFNVYAVGTPPLTHTVAEGRRPESDRHGST